MKHLNITFIFIVLLMNLVSFKAYAWFETIDGIKYELGDSKGAVVYSAPGSGHVSIPSSITYYGREYPVYSINNGAFRHSKITSITLPNSLERIGQEAFEDCSGLTSITLPNSLKYIGDGAFKNCTNLAFITIPDGIETIGSNTFWNCKSLISISLPNSLKEINNGAFKNCDGLTSVKIPNSVTKIGSEAFYGCNDLTIETIPNSVKYIGSEAFAYCVKLTSITIPNSVTEICSRTFYHCSRLTSVTIPNSVTSICNRSFEGCGLTSVTIPSSVRNIESNAFADCNLKNVYCYMESIPSTGTLAFGESAAYITFHVPACSISDYQNIAPWSEFGNIVALSSGDEEPTVKKCATPTISYTKGKLSFKCATNGASYVTTITDTDIKTHNGNEINLSVTYNISVYAKATGYEDSDIATATLCWIDSNPKTEGIANNVAKVEASPVLIQSSNGVLTITSEGNTEVTPIKVYNTAGQMKGSSSMTNGMATLDSNMDSGEIAIVKIGEKSVKIVVK